MVCGGVVLEGRFGGGVVGWAGGWEVDVCGGMVVWRGYGKVGGWSARSTFPGFVRGGPNIGRGRILPLKILCQVCSKPEKNIFSSISKTNFIFVY